MASSRAPQVRETWIHEAARKSSAPTVSYSLVISTLAFAGSVVYGAWVLNQSQLANVSEVISQLRIEAKTSDKRISEELTRRESELKTAINTILSELERRRDMFVNIKAFDQFSARVLEDIRVIRGQLAVLEQTKPSLGELQATSSALRDRIDKLYEMVESERRRRQGAPQQ